MTSKLSLEFCHELGVELCDSSGPFSSRSKECCPEMETSFLLTEASTSDNTYSSSIEKSKSVELIWCSTFGLCSVNSLLWKSDGGEEIHRTLEIVSVSEYMVV